MLLTPLGSGCGARDERVSSAGQEQTTRAEQPPERMWTDSTPGHEPEASSQEGLAKEAEGEVRPLAELAAGDANWLQFRGPRGLGVSHEKGLPVTWSAKQNVLWKTELPGPGASSPIVVGERIFVTCYSGFGMPGQPRGNIEQLKRHVVCLNRNDGKIVWNKEVAAELPEEPSTREEHYASSTPGADDERVYVFFGKSGVFAFDRDGRQLWHAEVGSQATGWGSAASPVLYEHLVIVNASVESQSLVGLDKKTGKEVWRAQGIEQAWNTPVLVTVDRGKTELVLAIFGKVLGFEPTKGEQLWSCATDIGWYMVPSLVAHEGVIYCIGGRSGGGLAVRAGGRGDVTQSHRLWTIRQGSNVSSPLLHQGHLYWMHDNLGIAYCAEAKTGKIVYQQRLPGAGMVYASPVLADGKIYCVSRNAGTFVLAAKPQFEQLAHNQLGDRSVFNASPAVVGGRLLLRSNRFLYCIGQQ